jgi:hypothetical protein
MRTRGRLAGSWIAGNKFYALGVDERRKGTAGDLRPVRCGVSQVLGLNFVIRKEMCQ